MMGENWNDAGSGFHPVSAPDYLPAPQLRELQLRRLKAVVERAFANVPPFRERMAERGLTPASIETLADLAKLPFSIKTDLRDNYPFGLFASPMSEIVRLHASSGTTGKPIVVAYTQEDLESAEREQALNQLKGEVGGLATKLAGRIVGESLDDDVRVRGTVDRLLAELESTSEQRQTV